MQITAATNTPILTLEDWFRLAPPKGREAHWVDGRSAKELARAWCPAGAGPRVPEEITELLESHRDLAGTVIEQAWPERRVQFDRIRGEPRNADLVAVGRGPHGRIAISVEAKADEPFDRRVADVLSAAERKLADGTRTGAGERARKLVEAVLTVQARPGAGQLRYQLLTAAAGALAFAKEVGANAAVLIVHEFLPAARTPAAQRNAEDLDAFVAALVGVPGLQVQPGRPLGPIQVPGSDMIPAGISLYVGKAVRLLPELTVPMPAR